VEITELFLRNTMDSIFKLKKSVEEIEWANQGMSRMSYEQHAPTRDVTGNSFPNGAIHIRWETSGQKWWIPSRSYLRLRCKLTKNDGNQLVDGDNIAPNMGLCANLFQSAEFRVNGKTVSRISDFMPQIDALEHRLNKSDSYLTTLGESTNFWSESVTERKNDVSASTTLPPAAPSPGRHVSEFEVTWTPPLSIFKIDHAIPSGKFELVLNPQTSSAYKLYAIESTGANKTPGATGDYEFSVDQMYFYANTVLGERADDLTYLLELEQTVCQSDKVDNTSFQQKNFDVSPSTYALTVAYQDTRVGSDTRFSSSKFRTEGDALTIIGDEGLKLNRMFINYAGQNLPSPDADPEFVASKDYTTQRYLESQVYSGAYFDTGGTESIEKYHERGSYYYFAWPRDGTDRSTRVQVHQQFNAATTTNMRVLLFSHSKQVARVKVENGRTVDVQLEDA
jgi:hypothetical protein